MGWLFRFLGLLLLILLERGCAPAPSPGIFLLSEEAAFEDQLATAIPLPEECSFPSLGEATTYEVLNRRVVIATAYTSSRRETDDTPNITASGGRTRYGIIACNFLAFGTKVRFPEIFGNEIFVVADRTHRRFNYRVDVWLPFRRQAKDFGRKKITMEILGVSQKTIA